MMKQSLLGGFEADCAHPCSLMKIAFTAALSALILVTVGFTQSAEDQKARLERLPQPWQEKVHRITAEEYEATLKYWAKKHAGLLSFEKRGESHDGRPIYLVKITDASVSDEDKQVVMISCLHGGPERSGTTTTLRLIEWLVGDSELARETRQKQVVLVLPIANPYAYFVTDRFGNMERIEVYDTPMQWWDLKTLNLTDPVKTPEVAAFISIMDEFQPEMHMDLHGTGLQAFPTSQLGDRTMLKGQTMFEVSACSYSNCGVRPWDPRVTEAMVRAGQEAGYGSDRAEADAQRCFWNADHTALQNRLWIRPRPERFRTPFYSYMKHHTMISTTEVGWEDSGVARISGILALGNKPWADENKVSGYPVSRVRARAGRFITSYGQTARERRRSRVELWQAQGDFADGMLYPEYDGRMTYICAVTPQGKAVLNSDPNQFLDNLRQRPEMNMAAIEQFLSLGPEYRQSAEHRISSKGVPMQHGIGFRLRIPYRAPELLDVALNGHSLKQSVTDGYEAWYADGYTQVQINVPPEKSQKADLYVITCAYKPDEQRRYGWEPPAAVQEMLRKK